MTDQNNTTTVETSQTNPKASLEQWQHLPIYTIRDRVKPLAVLRYGETNRAPGLAHRGFHFVGTVFTHAPH